MGTITKRETIAVISDLLTSCGIPRDLWKIMPGGELNILIGDIKLKFHCEARLSHCQLKALEDSVIKIIEVFSGRA